MTRNDMKVSARRLANDAEQLRGRQRNLLKLSGGDRLKEKWKAEHAALQLAIEALDVQIESLEREAEGMDDREAEHLGMLNSAR